MNSRTLLALLSLACLACRADAHGELVWPPSRNAIDAGEVNCDASTDHCSAAAKGTGCVNFTHPGQPCLNGQASFWYSQGCFIGCAECDHKSGRRQTDLCGAGKRPTQPDHARSVNVNATRGSELDIYRHNPWSAPGNAPVADACGLAGGWPWGQNGAEAGNYVNTTHAQHGMNGTALRPPRCAVTWQIGGEAEAVAGAQQSRRGLLLPAVPGRRARRHQRGVLPTAPTTSSPASPSLAFADGSRAPIAPTIVSGGHAARRLAVGAHPGAVVPTSAPSASRARR